MVSQVVWTMCVYMGEHEAVSCTYQKREYSVMLIIIIILMQIIAYQSISVEAKFND